MADVQKPSPSGKLFNQSNYQENLWLVALYEDADRPQELLTRLRSLGVDTEEASILHVDLNDHQRAISPVTQPAVKEMSLNNRFAISGSVVGGIVALVLGLGLYQTGALEFSALAGVSQHALAFVSIGILLGALVGSLLGSAKSKIVAAPVPAEALAEVNSDGYLVAVKMPPELGEQAETIARSLGAKQILC